MGLRFSPEFILQIMEGVQKIEESSVDQMILARGEARGVAQSAFLGERRLLVHLASKRLGDPSDSIRARLNAIESAQTTAALADRHQAVESWEELQAEL